MCLALPASVVAIETGDMATVALEGVRKKISLALVDDVAIGDYVLVHVGYALLHFRLAFLVVLVELLAMRLLLFHELLAGEPPFGVRLLKPIDDRLPFVG